MLLDQDGVGQLAGGDALEGDAALVGPLDGQVGGRLVAGVVEGVGHGEDVELRGPLGAAELGLLELLVVGLDQALDAGLGSGQGLRDAGEHDVARAVDDGDLGAGDVGDHLLDDVRGQSADRQHAGAVVGGAGDVAGGGAHEDGEGQRLGRLLGGDDAERTLGVAEQDGVGDVQARQCAGVSQHLGQAAGGVVAGGGAGQCGLPRRALAGEQQRRLVQGEKRGQRHVVQRPLLFWSIVIWTTTP